MGRAYEMQPCDEGGQMSPIDFFRGMHLAVARISASGRDALLLLRSLEAVRHLNPNYAPPSVSELSSAFF